MKLKEPLQGLKMIQGHTCMHLAMFSASFLVNTQVYNHVDTNTELGIDDSELNAFFIQRWGHLVSAIF